MPVSSFSNRSFAYRRGDKEKRIVSRVGPYPVNKPSTTTSNGVEYTKYISGMYAFGHTPGSPNYGNLAGGVNGTYNHGWFNGQSSEQNVAHFQQIFDEATSHTEPQIDGQYGYKTVSFHGPNNKLYGWIEHNQRWSNDPNDAQTSVGSGNLGGGNVVFQVNGPGSGVAYTYYFDPNAIDGTNTDSPTMDDIIDLRFWSGSYPADDTSALGKSKGVSYDFGGGNLLTWTKAPADITQAERTITNATLAASAQPGDIVVVENSEIQKYTSSGGWYTHTSGNCIFAIVAVNGNVLTIMFTDMMYYPANGSSSQMNQSLKDYFDANTPVGDVPSNAVAGYMPESNQSGNAGQQRWRGGVATLYSYFKSNIQSGLDTSGGSNDPSSWGIDITGSVDPAVIPETNNFQVGVNGLLLQRYVQRNAGFSSINHWRDKNTSTAPTLGFGAQIIFNNSTDAGIFRSLLSGVVQLPTTSGAYSQYNGHKPIRFHFKDGTTEDFGPDDGSSTQRVWNTGNSSSTVDVYTTAADNGSRTMSLTGSAGTSGFNSGSIYFSSLNAWNGTNARVITADSNDFNLPDGTDVTIEFWYKIPVTPPTQGNGYLFDLGDGNYGWLQAYAWNQNGTHTLRVGTYFGAIWQPPVGSEVGMTLNQWYHLAITRESDVWKVYLDGVFQGSKANSALGSFDTWPDRISLGGFHNMSYPNYGVVSYISDFRFVKGRAVYTGNFTPPSGPLTTTGGTYPSMTNITNPTSAQTLLLTQISSGSIVDNSQYARSYTTYNTVSVEGGAGSAPIDWSNKEIIGISYATISGHGGHDDPYLIGQNVASHLFHNNVNGQTQIFGQYTDP